MFLLVARVWRWAYSWVTRPSLAQTSLPALVRRRPLSRTPRLPGSPPLGQSADGELLLGLAGHSADSERFVE